MIFTAFSYSDKNFTVIGNLCFVHIHTDNKKLYDIPPAICDRMLDKKILYPYVVYNENDENFDIGLAIISNNKITLISTRDKGYLSLFFPIDSNK